MIVSCSIDTAPKPVAGFGTPKSFAATAGRGADDEADRSVRATVAAEDAGQVEAPCVPDCVDRECGPNGCNGTCGRCGAGQSCVAATGQCSSAPGRAELPNARCGNGIIESGEQCDGGNRCSRDCTVANDQDRCLAFENTAASDQCKQCICNRCTQLALNCYSSEDPARDVRCGQVAECGHRHACYDSSCYCGDELCLPPRGECLREVEEAVGSTSVTSVLACYADPDCATFRARALGECLARNCDSECG